MRLIKELSIQQIIITSITVILAVSVITSAISVYNIITQKTIELVYDQASEINKQIVLNYENYTDRVKNITNILQKKTSEYDINKDLDELTELFKILEEIEDDIVAITLFNTNGEVILSTNNIILDREQILNKQWYKNAKFNDNIIHFSSPHRQDIYELPMEEIISCSKIFEYNSGGITKRGILLIDMNFKGLSSLSKITNLGEDGHIIIVDVDDKIVYSSDNYKYGYNSKSYDLVKETIFGSTNAIINGTSMAVNINTISSTRWRIATFQNINTIDEGMNRALYTVILLVIATMFITFLVAYFVAKVIINPLKKLNRAIVKFQKGIYDSKVEVQGQKEIKIVTVGFNAMIDKIHQLMDEVVKEQESKRKTELSVLQNQINPHFLYNTLDCIIWLAEENRNEDLVETVNALSTYFRVSLSKGKQFIPISEELRHIESYMIIQRMRYNNSFSYSIECSEMVSKYKIMKLILQPLVENAIYHGIDKDDKDSYIKIVVKDDKEYIILSVINSGYGITDKKIQDLYKMMSEGQDNGSVGMKNVYQRIKLFYGEKAKLLIESELDENTTVSIVIPKDRLGN